MTEGISAISGNIGSNYYPGAYNSINSYESQVNSTENPNAKPTSLIQGSNNTVVMISGENKNDSIQSLADIVTELMKLNAALEVIGTVLDVSI